MKKFLKPLKKWFNHPVRAVLSGILLIITGLIIYLAVPYPVGGLLEGVKKPVRILDRNGRLLMDLTPGNRGYSEYVPLSAIPVELSDLLLFTEDRYFYTHHGISVKSMVRALLQNIRSLRVVSGGSTLTQQLAKARAGINRNNAITKVFELVEAVKLELHFSKHEILEAYWNSVYMGNHIYGIGKAAQVYYGKSLSALHLLEMASLITILRAPVEHDPYRKSDTLLNDSRKLLKQAAASEVSGIKLTKWDVSAYLDARLNVLPNRQDFFAPHFSLYAYQQAKNLLPRGTQIDTVQTTLDLALYQKILSVMKNDMKALRNYGALHAALVLIDNKTAEVRVMVGAVDYFTEKGEINGALIKNQAASTMKPFNYALALESRKFTASSILPDIYSEFHAPVGKYIPRNFSESFHGPVRLAVALGSSYNVPAVYLLDQVGLYPCYKLLKEVGFDSINRQPSFYGLGLTLGNADVTLTELVSAYTLFPRQGMYSKPAIIQKVGYSDGSAQDVTKDDPRRVLSSESAWLISHILSEYKYKVPAFGANSPVHFPFPVAVKTGTSKDFRDNFIVAYTSSFTIGIWVGNLFGKPLEGLPASSGAGAILRDVLLELYHSGGEYGFFNTFPEPQGKIDSVQICTLSGMKAGAECPEKDLEYYIAGTQPAELCTWHKNGRIVLPENYKSWADKNLNAGRNAALETSNVKIVYPMNGDIFKLTKSLRLSNQKIPLEAVTRFKTLYWFCDGVFIGEGREVYWTPSAGLHQLEARVEKREGSLKDEINFTVVEDGR